MDFVYFCGSRLFLWVADTVWIHFCTCLVIFRNIIDCIVRLLPTIGLVGIQYLFEKWINHTKLS